MTLQYLRESSLILAPKQGSQALDLSQFHFKFIIQRGDRETPNTCSVRVYNVSDETVNKIKGGINSEFSRIILKAGYKDASGLIFQGNIQYINKGHENQVDSYIDIVAADGDAAYNYAIVSHTLAAGATSADQIKVATDAMSKVTPGVLGVDHPPEYSQSSGLPRGKVMHGMARDYLRTVSRVQESSWSIQDNQIKFIPLSGYLAGDPVVLTAATGLIGYPQQTLNGVTGKCLLNPNLKIGSRIFINNALIQRYSYSLSLSSLSGIKANQSPSLKLDTDGIYRILLVEHSGDTRGDQWYSDFICVSLDVVQTNTSKLGIAPFDVRVTLPIDQNEAS